MSEANAASAESVALNVIAAIEIENDENVLTATVSGREKVGNRVNDAWSKTL